jgi:hypothetical protein
VEEAGLAVLGGEEGQPAVVGRKVARPSVVGGGVKVAAVARCCWPRDVVTTDCGQAYVLCLPELHRHFKLLCGRFPLRSLWLRAKALLPKCAALVSAVAVLAGTMTLLVT